MSQNINDPLIAAIIKYRSHPSIIAIKDKCNSDLHFNFSFVEYDEIMKANKATQNTDIPTKLIKENSDIFADFIFENLNDCIAKSLFLSSRIDAIITPVHKKVQRLQKIIIDLSVFCHIFLKYKSISYSNECLSILNLSCQNISVVSERILVLSTAF